MTIDEEYGYYDRQQRKISVEKWEELRKDPDYKIINQTTVGHYFISTVWLGRNYNLLGGVQGIFGTMVFDTQSIGEDLEEVRYEIEEHAKKGHQYFVRKYEKQIAMEDCVTVIDLGDDWVNSDSGYYDRQGRDIGLKRWGELLSDPEYKIIEQTTVGRYLVSTVWLGHNYNFWGGAPLIFETMVFDQVNDNQALDQDRYSTEEDAKEGHEHYVKKYNKKIEKGE